MRSKLLKFLAVIATIVLLSLPEIVLTQAPGTAGRVLNRRLRRVYATLTAALADPALLPNDILLAAGTIVEPGPVVIPAGWSGTIVGESRTAFVPRIIQAAPGICTSFVNCMIDASFRGGPVQIIGLNLVTPTPSPFTRGIETDNNGNALTIRNCRISGASAAALYLGIVLGTTVGEFGGPFTIEGNSIGVPAPTPSGTIGIGIAVGGTGAAINATIRRNRIGGTGVTITGSGISVDRVAPIPPVVLERNTVDGGGPTAASNVGIGLGPVGAPGTTVRRNTVRNFSTGTGIVVDGSAGAQILANAITNNLVGIGVDPSASSGPGITIGGTAANGNNITSALVGATGLLFDPTPLPAGYNLNATNNFWGTAGPGSLDTTCPEAPACTPATGTVIANGNAPPTCAPAPAANAVSTCPFRRTSNFNAGA